MCALLYKYQPEYPPSSNPPSSQQPSSKIFKHIISSANKAFIFPTTPLKMQLTTVFTILTAGASVASAWSFKGWANSGYAGPLLIAATGGLADNVCIDITLGNNQMTSFKWKHGVDNPCKFRLYNNLGCNGAILATAMFDMDISTMTSGNNMASSLWVDCF